MALAVGSAPRPFQCPRCRAPLPEFTIRPNEETCAACGTTFAAVAFSPPPPVVRGPEAAFADALAVPGTGGQVGATPCAAHPNHAAVANCSRCGVFICDLCRIPLDGLELCPGCFDRLSREGALGAIETHYFDASGLAIALGVVGWLTSCLGLLIGPVVIALGLKALRQRRAWREAGGRGGPIAAIASGILMTFFGLILLAAIFGEPSFLAGLKEGLK